jgi:hypothetical protein
VDCDFVPLDPQASVPMANNDANSSFLIEGLLVNPRAGCCTGGTTTASDVGADQLARDWLIEPAEDVEQRSSCRARSTASFRAIACV